MILNLKKSLRTQNRGSNFELLKISPTFRYFMFCKSPLNRNRPQFADTATKWRIDLNKMNLKRINISDLNKTNFDCIIYSQNCVFRNSYQYPKQGFAPLHFSKGLHKHIVSNYELPSPFLFSNASLSR